MEKAPLKNPLAALRKNVLSQKLWGVASPVLFEVDNFKFEALELREVEEFEEECEEDGFNILSSQ